MICGHPLQATYRDRTIFNTATSACRFTRTVADTTENARKYVGFTIRDIRIAESTLGNQADVLRNVSMCGTSPLTVDNFVEVLGVGGISWFHSKLTPDIFLHPANSTVPYLALA
jgi:hypothetical protein